MSHLDNVILPLINFIENTITDMGSAGIMLLMAMSSANIPIPSEVILTFAGYLSGKGAMGFHAACFSGALGGALGSTLSYSVGYFGGRPFVEKYGRWLLISKNDMITADRWINKYGFATVFICRMLPVVQTFISLPAGILKANYPRFVFFTFAGSLIWSYILVYAGLKLGEHRDKLLQIWHKFDYAIAGIILALFVIYLYKHLKHLKES